MLFRNHRLDRPMASLLHRLFGLCLDSPFLLQLRMGGLWRMSLVPVTRCLLGCESELVLVTCLLRIAFDLVDLGLEGL